jgi:hypothetical protein
MSTTHTHTHTYTHTKTSSMCLAALSCRVLGFRVDEVVDVVNPMQACCVLNQRLKNIPASSP